MGQRFGSLLAGIPQWRQLMAGTGLHPIRDFNHILLSGPQMRDPRHLVATASYRVGFGRMKKAVDRVIARSHPKGRWLAGFGVPVAAIGRGHNRRVVLLPRKRMLVVLPARAEKKIAKVRKMKGFRTSGKTAAAMYIVTPWRGFMRTPIRFPKSIQWLRLRVSIPTPGRFVLAVEARDSDAGSAARNKLVLQRLIETLRPHPLVPAAGLLGVYLFDRPTLWVKGDLIRGRVKLRKKQVSTLLNLVDRWLVLRQSSGQRARSKKAPAARKP